MKTTRLIWAAIVAVSCLTAGPLPAQDSKPKLISTKGGGGWSSLDELKSAAAKGNARACGQLGEMMLSGTDVPRDVAQALGLLERAARGGDARGAFRMGMVLDDGELVARDSARAAGYFRAAAAGGVAEAFYNLGAAYSSARGVKRNHVEALGWLILAGKRGAQGEGEKQLRAHIAKLGRTEWIAAGEQRAVAIEEELAQGTVAGFLPPSAPLPAVIAPAAAADGKSK